MQLSTEIKEARAKAGLSQSQAAKAWEVPVQTLQKWEQGVQAPRGLALKALRSILDAILGAVSTPSGSEYTLAAAPAVPTMKKGKKFPTITVDVKNELEATEPPVIDPPSKQHPKPSAVGAPASPP